MKDSFWLNKPVEVSDKNIKNILSSQELLEKVNKEIEVNRFQLDYNVIQSEDLKDISYLLNFINNNYVTSEDETFKLIYTTELLSFYLPNSLIIEFYPKGSKTVIGYIVGKRSNIHVCGKSIDTSEVNFLCVIPKLRSLGISSYMINVLTREIVMRHDINTAHYTISNKIKSPHFGEKVFYHRFINIPQLFKTNFVENVDQNKLIQAYNNFSVSNNFISKHHIKYIHNEEVDDNLIEQLYSKYIQYCKDTYKIYEHICLEEFKRTFTNDAFHHFIVYKKDEIVSYVCMFRLDSYNSEIKGYQRAGFYYHMFLNDKINELEFIHQYVYTNNIFDVITFSDIFDMDYNKLRCIRGSGVLRYYFYNMICNPIKNSENGLITI